MIIKGMLAAAVVALGTNVAVADSENYTLNVNRLAGTVECTVTNPQSDKAAFDCAMRIKGNKNLGLEMKQAPTRFIGDHAEGFYGIDKFDDGKVAKNFIVVADKNKAVKFVSFADVSQLSQKEIRANIAGNAASGIKAVSISPLHVLMNDDKSEIKVGVWFTLYSQDASIAKNTEKGIIPDEVMGQIELQVLHAISK